MNPVNLFFKRIKAMEKAASGFSTEDEDGVTVWKRFSHECLPEDCLLREDGLWETNPEQLGRNNPRKFVFIFRSHPNYCCAGQPVYSPSERAEFLEKSETEKLILSHEGFEFVWGWDEVIMPTRIVWGMSPGHRMFYLRKDGEVLIKTSVKKHFKEFVEGVL